MNTCCNMSKLFYVPCLKTGKKVQKNNILMLPSQILLEIKFLNVCSSIMMERKISLQLTYHEMYINMTGFHVYHTCT